MNGTDLLTQFRESGSEAAFGELVRRYTSLVYSAARRRLANDTLAQEATQTVFIRLARSVPKLPSDAALAAWLHRTTLHVSVDLWRSEYRRSVREDQAAAMQTEGNETALWNEMTPVVDEALNKLNAVDRQTLLLRFFQQKSMRDLGATLGVSEDAAKMRVGRALERLRRQLTASGITCSAFVLGTLLGQRSVEAVPGPLVAVLASISWPQPATGLAGLLLRVSTPKLAMVAAGLILAGVVAFVLLRTDRAVQNPEANPSAAAAVTVPAADIAAVTADAERFPADAPPDPLKLLQAVARARNQFTSGSMTLETFSDRFDTGHKETNYLRSEIVFDGIKKKFDSVTREYRYTRLLPESLEDEAKVKEQNLDREAAVRAGLLTPFEAHIVSTYDGVSRLEYRETDGRPESAVIKSPSRGSSDPLFDPRCLGLRLGLYPESTVENCLGYEGEASVKLIGMESIDGVAAWHITVRTAPGETLGFWIDSARPRVLRHVKGSDMANSKYDDATPDNPIPIEVTTREYHQGKLFAIRRYVRSRAEFNTTINPILWTLAGLGMKTGTSVGDDRISRRIGYWTGSGLEDSPPPQKAKQGTNAPASPDRSMQLALLENDPGSTEALAAARWILRNSPDGPDVEKAAEAVLRYHLGSPEMAMLAPEMERMRHRCSRKLLEAMLEQNPDSEIRAAACFSLATLLKDQAEFGKNKSATRDAEKYFEQVITEFSQSRPKGADFARRSKPELNEIRHIFVGHPAPPLEGSALDGPRLKLSDYRGQIVVLFFWYSSVASDASANSKLLESMEDQRFVVIGINGDRDAAKAKAAIEKYHWTWPTIHDGRDERICTAWNVHSWLSTFVIDAKGVIRYRGVRDRDLTNAVATLLRE